MSRIIGIDLGSTLSEVAVVEGGKPTIIVNEEGSRTTPSVIGFLDNGERKVGAAAKRQMVTNPKSTINLIKRFMGGTYDEVKDNISHIQYDVINKNGYPRIPVGGKEYSPEELSAMILGKLKKCADDLIDSLRDGALEEITSKGREEAVGDAGAVAENIALGALHYYLLQTTPTKDMLFNPKESLSFNGNTGPYLQYMGARINSILGKAGEGGLYKAYSVIKKYSK